MRGICAREEKATRDHVSELFAFKGNRSFCEVAIRIKMFDLVFFSLLGLIWYYFAILKRITMETGETVGVISGIYSGKNPFLSIWIKFSNSIYVIVLCLEIWIYPIKSCAGISMQEWPLGISGFLYDRNWMLVDESSKFITQRDHPKVSLIHLLHHRININISFLVTYLFIFVRHF